MFSLRRCRSVLLLEMGRHVGAVHEMGRKRNQIAEVTKQAAEVMRERCDQLSHHIQSTAAVSEESAASAEEVSASSQEQTAGVEQMCAGAQEQAALAAVLTELVERFTLDVSGAASQTGAKSNIRPIRVA